MLSAAATTTALRRSLPGRVSQGSPVEQEGQLVAIQLIETVEKFHCAARSLSISESRVQNAPRRALGRNN